MKILLGLSGGVDSAVSARLLREGGHEVCAVTLRMTDAEPPKAASDAARRMQIPHFVADCRAEFEKAVLGPFARGYRDGQTPNPCVICNAEVKFKALLGLADERGFDAVATGHYAKAEPRGDWGVCALKRAADASKDQSYVLYRLTPAQLSRAVFPLGGLLKSDVREMAREYGIFEEVPKDSMDVCFVPKGTGYAEFLREQRHFEPESGTFTDGHGRILGTHSGQWQFTVGQRRGLGVALGRPLYVTRRDAARNEVVLGEEAALYSETCVLRDCRFAVTPKPGLRGSAKIRYGKDESPAEITACEGGEVTVRFDRPRRAVTPGQSLVLYDGDWILGGGIIDRAGATK